MYLSVQDTGRLQSVQSGVGLACLLGRSGEIGQEAELQQPVNESNESKAIDEQNLYSGFKLGDTWQH